MWTINTSAGESVDSASRSASLLHHRRRCHLAVPPVSTTMHGQRQFLPLFQHVDHVAVPGGPSCGGINKVDRLQHHQAAALSMDPCTTTSTGVHALRCDEENSSSSNDSVAASRSRISDVTAESRDTADEKLSRFQRPEHRQVATFLVC